MILPLKSKKKLVQFIIIILDGGKIFRFGTEKMHVTEKPT